VSRNRSYSGHHVQQKYVPTDSSQCINMDSWSRGTTRKPCRLMTTTGIPNGGIQKFWSSARLTSTIPSSTKVKGMTPVLGINESRSTLYTPSNMMGQHKSRLIAGGHLTDTPIDSVYSSIVSLRGIRMLTYIAEHNGSEVWVMDIGWQHIPQDVYQGEGIHHCQTGVWTP
jgi:hypothetical protein